MKKELFIVGAGSVGGHIAHNIVGYSDEYKVAGFFDDDLQKVGKTQFGIEVLGTVKDLLKLKNANVLIGIAFPKLKRKIIELLSVNQTLKFPTLIHPKAWISKGVSIGKGCIIYPGTTINYGSEINDFVCINMNCSLGHHTFVGRYSSFAPGVNTGGHSIVEEGTDIGIGASTLQGTCIGSNSIVGGQAMVISDVKAESTVVGIPAKLLNKSK
ncbi:acetyltransferase [Aliifodinibius salipaludis]|uniref:Acetyltransferase n=1 Tax=Fodinibius salipaludis TaxID=2032627 RepID=A0A2A2G8U3_9BACT|nr:acetyltransferase [Aliifodinibius salipaludis]PAU94021.1 acetyltransferase [Aliifodinibius salipaludis]